jgi:hypothetical protein
MQRIIPQVGQEMDFSQVLECFLKGIGVPLPFKNIPECLADRANSLEIPQREYKLDLTGIAE